MAKDFDAETEIGRIAEIVLAEGLSDAFRAHAVITAQGLSADHIDDMQHLLHYPPAEPPAFSTGKHGLGGWLSACQFAVFEVMLNIGAPALSTIRSIAWGPYDWTQGNAIELLIRFAAKDIERRDIISEITAKFPDIRYEAQLYAIEPLIGRLEAEPALASVFGELARCSEFARIVREMTERR